MLPHSTERGKNLAFALAVQYRWTQTKKKHNEIAIKLIFLSQQFERIQDEKRQNINKKSRVNEDQEVNKKKTHSTRTLTNCKQVILMKYNLFSSENKLKQTLINSICASKTRFLFYLNISFLYIFCILFDSIRKKLTETKFTNWILWLFDRSQFKTTASECQFFFVWKW